MIFMLFLIFSFVNFFISSIIALTISILSIFIGIFKGEGKNPNNGYLIYIFLKIL